MKITCDSSQFKYHLNKRAWRFDGKEDFSLFSNVTNETSYFSYEYTVSITRDKIIYFRRDATKKSFLIKYL